MIRIIAIVLAVVAVAAPTVSQAENPFNGSWNISYNSTRNVDLKGTAVINGTAGTWNVVMSSLKNPCIGREHPIIVQKASAEELVLTVNRAATLTGCKDSTYIFKKIDDMTLKGELGDGRAATLTRK